MLSFPTKLTIAERDARAFVDIEPQAIAGDRVAHLDLHVAVLAIEQLEEKRGVVRARGGQAELVDRGDLLLELRAQLFFLERGRAVDLHIAGSLRDLLLLLLDLALGLVLLLQLRRVDALRCARARRAH